MYEPKHIEAAFRISSATVRNWSSEFERHLSPTARPGKNRHRTYTDDDLKVFALVSQMKNEGSTFADIHASLDAGQRGELPDMDTNTLALRYADKALIAQVDLLQRDLAEIRTERDTLREQLATALEHERENIRLSAQLEDARDRAEQLQARLDELQRQTLNAYRDGFKDGFDVSKPDD
jgi:DNA-binding transcriptional MerR regulator